MTDVNTLALLFGALLLTAMVATSLTKRLGMPLLLVFLGVGMLAGDSGPGGLIFNDFDLSFTVGNLALAVILFDGGLRTKIATFRVALRPALLLATLGVALTAGITGGFAAWILQLPLLYGFLIGSIVGSTDAAAVFALLRSSGIRLNERVGATLEIESGMNDPMAIFLVIMLIAMVQSGAVTVGMMVMEFIRQFGIGLLAGVAGGWLIWRLTRRLLLPESLHPLLLLGSALALFGATAKLGGSGFLAVYCAGMLIGNRPMQARDHNLHVLDGMAWLAQASMFLLLGLLSTPSRLLPELPLLLPIALFLMLVARPLSVMLCLPWLRFRWREMVFISWVGLRGAVPIVLAVFPLLAGLDHALLMFDAALAVVVCSLLIQGSTLGWLARKLKVDIPGYPDPLSQHGLHDADTQDWQLLQYRVAEHADVVDVASTELPIRHGVVEVLGVWRQGMLLHREAGLRFRPGDLVLLAAADADMAELGDHFAASHSEATLPATRFFGEFYLHGDAELGEVSLFCGCSLPGPEDQTLAEWIRHALHRPAVVGDQIALGRVWLTVHAIEQGQITSVGLKLPAGSASETGSQR
ncbi:potassium/proton antiporter [Chitinilyticum piscinae]|uniref:Potassium/proton antiporter n=1 Tax=Chitinilyticum piscinae TaxID=2866724 RepID=A0A8J7FJ34_9NEIS|nr:potassium/proton antiporter [Chitinilyticum piscinae]MBE9608762.1 potassium/proton antiporter [Chitinilyticum piscinae]